MYRFARTAAIVSALALAWGAPAYAQDRSDSVDACKDQAKRRGHGNIDFDNVRFDKNRNGATVTGLMKANKDDRFDFVCRVDDRGRVRDLTLNRARDNNRDNDRGTDRGTPRKLQFLVGKDSATVNQNMTGMGYELVGDPNRRGNDGNRWFSSSTGSCLSVRYAGSRVSDIRQRDARDCRPG